MEVKTDLPELVKEFRIILLNLGVSGYGLAAVAAGTIIGLAFVWKLPEILRIRLEKHAVDLEHKRKMSLLEAKVDKELSRRTEK